MRTKIILGLRGLQETFNTTWDDTETPKTNNCVSLVSCF